jgi:cytochrome P450
MARPSGIADARGSGGQLMATILANADISAAGTSRRWGEIFEADRGLSHPSSYDLADIPGKAGLPLLGSMVEILRDPLRFSTSMYEAHGPIYRFRAYGNWHLHVAGSEANELVLFDSQSRFSAREGWAQVVEPLFPGALLVKDGAQHRCQRRVLGEAFKQARLTSYQDIFVHDIRSRLGGWRGQRIDAYTEARELTFSIAASTFLGIADDHEAGRAIDDLRNMMAGLLALVRGPAPSFVRARGKLAKRRLERLLRGLIDERRRRPGNDFLSRVAALTDDNGQLLPTSTICDSFIFLMSAAHDTLASALTSILYFLAEYPEWAEEVRKEVAASGVRSPSDAATAQQPLMDMFYKEALRLNGPAPIIWRRAAKDCSLYGKHIPAGTMVGANTLLSHRLPDVFPHPERFDPLRFSTSKELERGRFAFVPFGAGVHKCLGVHFADQQARIFIAALLDRYALTRADDQPVAWYHWPNARPRRPLLLDVRPLCRET